METKHTPEPWNLSWEERGRTWPGLFHLEENDILIYGMDGEEGIYASNEADLKLIDAAPETAAERDRLEAINAELVEALEKCMPIIDCWHADADKVYDNACAVVNKAKADQKGE